MAEDYELVNRTVTGLRGKANFIHAQQQVIADCTEVQGFKTVEVNKDIFAEAIAELINIVIGQAYQVIIAATAVAGTDAKATATLETASASSPTLEPYSDAARLIPMLLLRLQRRYSRL